MGIAQLRLNQFRNIEQAHLECSPQLNVIVGENGSGKSSLLEAIYAIGVGRSFRSRRAQNMIRHEQDALVVFIESEGQRFGLQRQRNGEYQIKIDGEIVKTQSALAMRFPMQLIHPDGYRLVTEGPKNRRSFIDWAVFHVEQSFFKSWANYKKVLQQRNALLRIKANSKQLDYWTKSLVQHAYELNKYRTAYVEDFEPVVMRVLGQFLPEYSFNLGYYAGWNQDSKLADLFESSLSRDQILGYTQVGAHKADLKIKANGIAVNDILSRGQIKLLVCALLIAQGEYIYKKLGKRTIYLVDDFAAELDLNKRKLFAEYLQRNESQVFITAIEKDMLDGFDLSKCNMFHVEHGRVLNTTARAEHG
ncbi:DNA replication/repair protein RecF [Alginatibacterium sediminis]|uniref:DNA replication and repair protein RecF n=1 Tax=Alginatibacterium sediminis TaxID=2164068 RepID=A0A420ENJ7_9ALTE|nr:DNA replication/repair protein RecF [Alginatibacterium sediminis]RKF22260.1 DNA replication/repair protein RecF [Alginatibacterium sediminis]